MRQLALLQLLLLGACFEDAPMIEAPDATTGSTADTGTSATSGATGSSVESTGSEPGAFCPKAGVIACFDYDASETLPPAGEVTQRNMGKVELVDGGDSPPRAMQASLHGAMDGAATVHVNHGADNVAHAFALRIPMDCVPAVDGVIVASYSTFLIDTETSRVELVLLPDHKLGVRKGSPTPDPIPVINTIPAPMPDLWTDVEFHVARNGNTLEVSISSDGNSASAVVPVVDNVGMGRRSQIGLVAPAATTCKVAFDNVVFGPP